MNKRFSGQKNSRFGSGRAIAIFVAVCAIGCAGPAAADLVANGSFELGTFSGGNSLAQQIQPGGSALSNWTVSGAPATWYASGWNNNPQQIALSPRSGNFGINLADGTVNTVSLSETINLLPFQQYQLSFWVGNYSANNGPARLNVNITDGTSNTIFLSETAAAPITDEFLHMGSVRLQLYRGRDLQHDQLQRSQRLFLHWPGRRERHRRTGARDVGDDDNGLCRYRLHSLSPQVKAGSDGRLIGDHV